MKAKFEQSFTVDEKKNTLKSIESRVSMGRISSLFFTGLGFLLVSITFFLVLTLFQVGQRLTVLVQPLQKVLQSSQSLVVNEDFNKNLSSLKLVHETLVRNYVIKRNMVIPDKIEMMKRWGGFGDIFLMSSPSVFYTFVGKDLKGKVSRALNNGSVFVDIQKVEQIIPRTLSGVENWSVVFNLIYANGFVARHTASLVLVNMPSRVLFRPHFNNPVGALVIKYEDYPS